jgi:hypothetical protein
VSVLNGLYTQTFRAVSHWDVNSTVNISVLSVNFFTLLYSLPEDGHISGRSM